MLKSVLTAGLIFSSSPAAAVFGPCGGVETAEDRAYCEGYVMGVTEALLSENSTLCEQDKPTIFIAFQLADALSKEGTPVDVTVLEMTKVFVRETFQCEE